MASLNTNHPPTLPVYFLTEMWERYGFYVVQTLLALFLALHFKWEDTRIYPLVGSFTALTYISPVLGGWIADHLLGQKRTILVGAFVLMISYFLLSLFTNNASLLTPILAGIAVGTGLLKPNISSLLGNEYKEGSENRESGFTIFYVGINSGIIIGSLLPSHLEHLFGWHISFLSAAIGIILALIIFFFGIKRYRIRDYHPFQYKTEKIINACGLIVLLWTLCYYILSYPSLADSMFLIVVILSAGYLIASIRQEESIQSKQTLIIGLLCIISVVFWSFYFQMFMSLTLFISRLVQPTLLHIPFPPPYYLAIQSFGVIVFGIIMSRLRGEHSLVARGQRTANKFFISMLCMVVAYVIITASCYMYPGKTLIPAIILVPTYLIISVAELLLSPVGLAAITLFSSSKKVSTMMGIFFVSLGVGAYLAGKLSIITAVDPTNLSVIALKAHYGHAFLEVLGILVATTVICFFINRIIRRLLVNL